MKSSFYRIISWQNMFIGSNIHIGRAWCRLAEHSAIRAQAVECERERGGWKGGFASTKNDNFHTIRLQVCVCVCSFVVHTANTNKWVMHAIYRLYPIRWALLRQLWPGFQYIALFLSLVSVFLKRFPRAPPLLTHERRSHCLQAFHTHISLGYHLNLQIMIGEFWHFPRSLTRSRPKIVVRCTRKR